MVIKRDLDPGALPQTAAVRFPAGRRACDYDLNALAGANGSRASPLKYELEQISAFADVRFDKGPLQLKFIC